MTTAEYLRRLVVPAAAALLPPPMASREATALLLAIARQESGCADRRQHDDGPARGFYQFECGGGVRGVLTHPASAAVARAVLATLRYPADEVAVWMALEHSDILATVFARLLLWTDAAPLPGEADVANAWHLYLRLWRPGRPRLETWDTNFALAWDAVTEDAHA